MFKYNSSDFDPPAPFVWAVLKGNNILITHEQVPMLIDTGADISLVPKWVVEEMGIDEDSELYELVGFNNSRSVAKAVSLSLSFANRTFHGKFLIIDQPYGILGRNILNRLVLVLDEPKQEWNRV